MRTRGLSAAGLATLLGAGLFVAGLAGAARLAAAPEYGLIFSNLDGRGVFFDSRWAGATPGRIVQVGSTVVSGAAELRRALLAQRPGPLRFAIEREGSISYQQIEATSYSPLMRAAIFVRVLAAGLTLAIGMAAFVLRAGERIAWLFFGFCWAVSVHLTAYLAMIDRAPHALLVEQVALVLAAPLGLLLFASFPERLIGGRGWLAFAWLPFLVYAARVAWLVPGGASRTHELRSVLQAGTLYSGLVAVGLALLAWLQLRQARSAGGAAGLARSRALLAAVGLGIALPGSVNAARQVLQLHAHELDWTHNALPVVLFAGITGYSIARHNALAVDRFTASVIGYAATLLALGAATLGVVVGLPALVGRSGLVESPLAGALLAAGFLTAFNPLQRRIRRRIDRAFSRDVVADDAALRLLRELAETVKAADLARSLQAGLDTAMTLQGERAELWTRREGHFVRTGSRRLAADELEAGAEEAPDGDGTDEPEPIPCDGPLARALGAGSCGGVKGLADQLFDEPAQEELWARDLALAAPLLARSGLEGFLGVGRKQSGGGYGSRERAFLETVASHLGIALGRDAERMPRLGEYRLVRRIGTGGMAEVFVAEKHGPGGFERQIAIKRMLPHLAREADCVAMFLDEARIAAQLQHPHIVPILDIQQHEGVYFLAMEYLDGPDLGHLIDASSQRPALPLGIAAAFARAVLAALEHTHERSDRHGRPQLLIHRDVKPGNVLTSLRGEIKLADFGIARAEFRLHQSLPGLARGTLPYMSPEQERGKPVGPASDLYAAGALVYEMLAGEPACPEGPGRGAPVPLRRRVPGLPPELDAFVTRALAREPGERFGSAAQMRAALQHAIGPTPVADADQLAAYLARFPAPLGERLLPDEGGAPGTAPMTGAG